MTQDYWAVGVVVIALVSVASNILLVWYIRHFTDRSSLVHDVTRNMLTALEDFSVHMKRIYELPLFYGDETLKDLMEHSKEIVKNIREYRDGFIFGPEGEDFDDDEEEPPEEE